jgi:predicted acetyltransferase
MMSDDQQPFHDAPLDAAMSEALANQGLRIEQIDNATRVQNDPWLSAVARGFLEDEPVEVRREAFVGHTAHRRKLGVYDATCPQPEIPVATFASWPTELTVPGCTVSASTIYGRFGFGAAAAAANWEIRTRRAGWIGPEAPGRVDFVSRDQAREVAEALHERVRVTSPGEIALPGGHLNRFFGTSPDAEKAERLRTIQYRSPAGEVDGLAVYRVVENPDDFSESTLELSWLLAATDDAYAGLWRFLLEMDLIALLRASELGLDEPLWWMIADQRAAKITVTDHQYVRILDVPAALTSRRFGAADTIALEVDDSLGIAGGTFIATTDAEGRATVEAVDAPPAGGPLLRLGVRELSSLFLGGVSVSTLARAGRVEADDPTRIARVFQTVESPRLSFWY